MNNPTDCSMDMMRARQICFVFRNLTVVSVDANFLPCILRVHACFPVSISIFTSSNILFAKIDRFSPMTQSPIMLVSKARQRDHKF